MTIVESLKELAGKIKSTAPDTIKEETIAEVIKIISDNYSGNNETLVAEVGKKLYKPSSNGTEGQVLKTLGNGQTDWINIPKSEKIEKMTTTANLGTAGESWTKAEEQKIRDRVNAISGKLDELITAITTAGLMKS